MGCVSVPPGEEGVQEGVRRNTDGTSHTPHKMPEHTCRSAYSVSIPEHFTAPESSARLFSSKYSSIFISLPHNARTLSLFRSRGCSQDIFLTVLLSLDSSISLPLPSPNHPESYSLVDIDFLLSSILLSGFFPNSSYHLQIASFLSFAVLEILS